MNHPGPSPEDIAAAGDPLLKPVLFASNGYGEDAIACGIVEELLRRTPRPRILAMPLVGEGKAYSRLGVEVLGPRELLPSGGLILEGWTNLWRDLTAGLGRVTWQQAGLMRRLAAQLGAFVAVGDTYPTVLGGLFVRQPVIMVGTAKSNWFCAYSRLECAVFRRFCRIVFARDEPTAASLCTAGVNARWVGNGMMDLLHPSGRPLPLAGSAPCVAILPGSRDSAYRDLPVILEGVRLMGQAQAFTWAMALADSIDVASLAECVRAQHWEYGAPADDTEPGVAGWLRGHGQEILLARGRVGDVLHAGALVLGQAGTGNEQAVGLGRPVVSFDSDGRATPGWYRARQIGLLGDAMEVVPRSGEALARAALSILGDATRYRRMQEKGYERMGPPGASAGITDFIMQQVQAAPVTSR